MEKISWIKELVKAEQQVEDSRSFEDNFDFDTEKLLTHESVQFLLSLKTEFSDLCASFNEMKHSPLGRIKIFGIAKTHADFMLFRNGYKMIFTLLDLGRINVKFTFTGANYIPTMGQADATGTGSNVIEEDLVEAKWGAFGELIWTYKNLPVKLEYMVRHYMTLFIKESSK